MQSFDIAFSVFQFMEPEEILKSCSVNKNYNNACNSNELWKNLYNVKYIKTGNKTIFPYLIKGQTKLQIKGTEDEMMTYREAFKEEVRRKKIRDIIFSKHRNLLGFTDAFGLLLYHLYDTKGEKYTNLFINDLINGDDGKFLSLWSINEYNVPGFKIKDKLRRINPVLSKYIEKEKDTIIEMKDSMDTDDDILAFLVSSKHPILIPKTMKIWIRGYNNAVVFDYYSIDNYKIIAELIPSIYEADIHLKWAENTGYEIESEIREKLNLK